MNSYEESELVSIDISRLIARCREIAAKCIENGDAMPPAAWFSKGETSYFYWFCVKFQRDWSRIRCRIRDVVFYKKKLTKALQSLFLIRCMAIFAEKQLLLSFKNDYNTTKSKLLAVDEDRALFWALTAYWKYSESSYRESVWESERQRLSACHDVSLLPDTWSRGKTGKEQQLELARKEEREAKKRWLKQVDAVKRLEE